ncbi:MAG: Pyrrolo-quinoline quinone [Pseudonocardiales bacterium]|nr:Pyrrolo-quinoline quinone [Pseudonocardiales bacterium]
MKVAAAVLVPVLLVAACTPTGSRSRISASPPTAALSSSTAPTRATSSPPAPADAGWPTYHGDLARTGVSHSMPAVSGPLRLALSLALDGAVYAAPIVAAGRSVVGGSRTIVATENDTVYGLDASGRQLWRTHLGEPSPANERPCGNIDPLGITGTPIFDDATGSVFVAAEYGAPPRHELVALSAQTGTIRWRKAIDLPGADPVVMQERGALTVAGGRVWVPFGGLNGDCGDYKGRVVGVPLDGAGRTIAYTVPTTREAGIWAPPGPSVDAHGHLVVSVGNGAAGSGDPYDHSDSVLELDVAATLVDSFAPTTWASDNEADRDLGSQGPALVGPWIFIAGKSGTAYVLRQGRLGGIGGQVSSASLCRSFGGTAVDGSVVYVPCTDGVRAVRIDSSAGMHVLWAASGSITGSPVIGGGRVWALDTDAGVLHALDPATGRSLGQVTVGPVTRFATPALSGRTVLVPTQRGLAIVAAP